MADPTNTTMDVSHDDFAFALDPRDGLALTRLALGDAASWIDAAAPSGMFALEYDGTRIDGQTPGVVVQSVETAELTDGSRHVTLGLAYPPDDIEIDVHVIAYAGSSLVEQWATVRNAGQQPRRVERLDTLALAIPANAYDLVSYTSAWGLEFEEVREPLAGDVVLETRKGRASNDRHPWFALLRDDGQTLSASVMWSGNWVFRFEPRDDGGYLLSGGLHDWEFSKDLAPGQEMGGAHVALVLGQRQDLNDISAAYADIGRRHWYPHNTLSDALPVEWNHWFPYIDRGINEEVFKQNVDEALRIGCDVCTLDAGWFGPTDASTHWYDFRGDWHLINTERFPNGIRAVADYTHQQGLKFGLWCEIEGLGQHAALAEERPELVARRDGERLGYVCFGNPATQAWAFETLDRLITDYACDWIKLDFNLDPGAGCNRTDHGHGAGDGLYEHYQGYYRTLERIRQRHPEVILENCSSGGLRIDLGIARQTHMTFLSDPDWPEHDLQIFWGASTMLAPAFCLHWGWCEWWSTNKHPHQTFNPRDPDLQQHQLDYYVRNGMLGAFGYSQKLPELPDWVSDRLAYHVRVYKALARRFVRSGSVHRLTAQPRREGRGDRWAGFQYAMPDGAEHLLFVFRLDGGEPERTLRLQTLDPDRAYTLSWLDSAQEEQRSGAELMDTGIRFDQLPEEGSEIIHVH